MSVAPRQLVSGIALAIALTGCSEADTTPALTVVSSGSETGWWTTEVIDKNSTATPLPLTPSKDSGIIRIKADVFFAIGSSAIETNQIEGLEAIAQQIVAAETPVRVMGHTDHTGTTSYNLQLGHDRAATIRDHLIDFGVPVELIVDTDSRGEDCPIQTNSTHSGRAANRRVEMFPPDLAPECDDQFQ